MSTIVFPRVARPDVSVLMVTYGGWEFASRALRSLLENTDPCYEVIIVDNASTDDTASRLRDEVVNVRVVFNTANHGFGPASNQAASLATAPYLVLLNSDCFVHAGWLPPLLEAMDGDPQLGAVSPRVLNVDGTLQESGCLLFGNAYTQLFGGGDDANKPAYRFRRSVDYASGACLVLRRRFFLDLGGLDAAYVPAYFEDVDLSLRLRAHGHRTLVEPRSVVTHVRGASSGGSLAIEYWSRNIGIFRDRWNDTLAHRPSWVEPAPSARSVLSARDATAEAAILVITERAPGPDATADDAEAFHLFGALGAGWPDCRITALISAAVPPGVLDALAARGIEVAGVPDPVGWLEERRFHYDVVLFRSGPLYEAALDAFQPQAVRIEETCRLRSDELMEALGKAGVAPSRHASPAAEGKDAGDAPGTLGATPSRTAPVTRSVALLVLGMHRSGTSALAGCLSRLQVPLGEPLLPANFANERGYFEHADVVAIHDELLRSLGSSALTPAPLPVGWMETPAARAAKGRLRDVVRQNFAGAPLWALKDPRLCILLPLWLPLLEEMGIEPRFILVFRSPWEITRSLRHRDDLAAWESLDLWFRHTTASEASTRGRRRAFVTYDDILSAPEATLACLAEAIGVTWPMSVEDSRASIRGFLEPSLRHFGRAATLEDATPGLVEPVRDLHLALLELPGGDTPAARGRIDFRKAACNSSLEIQRRSRPEPGGSEEEYEIRWHVLEVPPNLKAGERASGRASFSHAGRLPLSNRALCLSYHWLDAADPSRVIAWEGPRTPVRRVLAPGETWSGEFAIQTPAAPGRYLLQIDLVREGVAWFSQQGAATTEAIVRVG